MFDNVDIMYWYIFLINIIILMWKCFYVNDIDMMNFDVMIVVIMNYVCLYLLYL